MGFAYLRRRYVSKEEATNLLLLRVFSLGKRSEQFYDAITNHWRYVGNIRLIAGPDLATSTIEPHEFLDYLTGKLDNQFIDSEETLERRLAEIDYNPDHDTRYRVGEFFCYHDTWKTVLSRLACTHDAILMDLRGFSEENAGCIFEISALANLVSLDQIVFVIDETTDEPFLQEVLQQVWQELAPSSPNRQSARPATVFRFEGSIRGGLPDLLKAVSAAAVA